MYKLPESSLLRVIKSCWQSFTKYVSSSSDLQVWQASDRKGNKYWQAYDPIKNRSVAFGSEIEMRMWIEQYYYR